MKNPCPGCRYNKCVQVGMSKEGKAHVNRYLYVKSVINNIIIVLISSSRVVIVVVVL